MSKEEKFNATWEDLDKGVSRLRVPGGWIVSEIVFHKSFGVSNGLVFIPDADAKWKVPQAKKMLVREIKDQKANIPTSKGA